MSHSYLDAIFELGTPDQRSTTSQFQRNGSGFHRSHRLQRRKMSTKADIINELKSLNLMFSEKQGVLELKAILQRYKKEHSEPDSKDRKQLKLKKDPTANMQILKLATLQAVALMLQVPVSKHHHKGEILLLIREELEKMQDEKVMFGKFAGLKMPEALEDTSYAKWLMEQENLNHPQASKMKAYFYISFQGVLTDTTFNSWWEHPTEAQPKAEVKKEEPVKKEKSTASANPQRFHQAQEVPIYTSEEEESETRKKAKDDSSDAASWMELGEKHKYQPIRRKTDKQ